MGRGGRRGLEIGALSNPAVTSHGLPMSLFLIAFCSAPTCHAQTDARTDRRNWSCKRRHYALCMRKCRTEN